MTQFVVSTKVVRGLEAKVSFDDLSEGVKSSNNKLYNSSFDFDSGDTYSSKMREFKSNEYSNEYNSGTIKNGLNSSN